MSEIEKHSPKWLIDKIRNSKSEAEALVYIYEYSKECQLGLISKDQHEKDVKEAFVIGYVDCCGEPDRIADIASVVYYACKFKTNE